MKFVFSPSKTKNNLFIEIFKIQEGQGPSLPPPFLSRIFQLVEEVSYLRLRSIASVIKYIVTFIPVVCI